MGGAQAVTAAGIEVHKAALRCWFGHACPPSTFFFGQFILIFPEIPTASISKSGVDPPWRISA